MQTIYGCDYITTVVKFRKNFGDTTEYRVHITLHFEEDVPQYLAELALKPVVLDILRWCRKAPFVPSAIEVHAKDMA